MSRFRINFLGLSTATKAGLMVMLMVLLLVLGLVTEWFMITNQIAHDNAQWCDTLNLITAKPVPRPSDPSANPSRQGQYLLYQDFLILKDRFGCQ